MKDETQGQVICAPTGGLIRAELGGLTVVESREALLLRRSSSQLVYGFPSRALAAAELKPCASPVDTPWPAKAEWFDVVSGTGRARAAAFRLPDVPEVAPGAYYFLRFAAMDRWYEEDEPLLCHPRDPFTRVDVRHSSRHIRVAADGVIVADTRRPLLLFETGLPVRYYIPWYDVASQYLRLSSTETVCCYKGRARYWHIDTGRGHHDDLAWDYPEPLQDAERVAGAVCFQQSKLALYVDGVREKRAPHYFTRDVDC